MIQPILDHDFVPAVYFNRDFLAKATKPFSIAVEREDGLVYRRDTKLGDNKEENCRYAERLIKTILWCAGGWKVMLAGDHDVYEYIRDAHMHFVCSRCGAVYDIQADLSGMIREAAKCGGHQVDWSEITAHGLCSACMSGREENGMLRGNMAGQEDA